MIFAGEKRGAEQSDRMNLVAYIFEDAECSLRESWKDVGIPGLGREGPEGSISDGKRVANLFKL
jgi:hypothetical protein